MQYLYCFAMSSQLFDSCQLKKKIICTDVKTVFKIHEILTNILPISEADDSSVRGITHDVTVSTTGPIKSRTHLYPISFPHYTYTRLQAHTVSRILTPTTWIKHISHAHELIMQGANTIIAKTSLKHFPLSVFNILVNVSIPQSFTVSSKHDDFASKAQRNYFHPSLSEPSACNLDNYLASYTEERELDRVPSSWLHQGSFKQRQ